MYTPSQFSFKKTKVTSGRSDTALAGGEMELDEEAKEDFDEHGLGGEDLDAQIEAVKSNIIGSKTATMYLRGMSRYIAWLYTYKRNVLSGELLMHCGMMTSNTMKQATCH
ncbi:hypothetical protein F442_11050 [Phytophthora nicotianae P10297]|uniref:Uncharacterized protein n=1 Tax=Phytophthora nicotianae P10297 TaxID=1317064 RepID=W2Z4G7_PHYNI|nr:hypothetical protein F442_11050 [Phytophthora nicotianae P10297]